MQTLKYATLPPLMLITSSTVHPAPECRTPRHRDLAGMALPRCPGVPLPPHQRPHTVKFPCLLQVITRPGPLWFRKGQTSVDRVPHRHQAVSARSGTAPATAKPFQNSQRRLKASILISEDSRAKLGLRLAFLTQRYSPWRRAPPRASRLTLPSQASRPRSLPATSYTTCRSAA
ncbi:hypothetical protein EDB85DRAFT_657499 [Lactarius pseudohatsudake]|nr:hypothetical protein EDB85DRAFT_657499 [Lactarius pseudohatsudake]